MVIAMKKKSLTKVLLVGKQPQELRRELQEGDTHDLRRRRKIIGLSLFGIGVTAVISLFQTGIVRHLPDPPIAGFDSDKVMSSDPAYMFGGADATLALATLAINLPLAAFGGANRACEMPLVPVLATGKSAIDAAFAGWYFYQMPTREKAWCVYCIVTAATIFGIFALTLPEAKAALTEFGRDN